jgi:hypothetical protein
VTERPRVRAGTTTAFLKFLEGTEPRAAADLRSVLPTDVYRRLMEAVRTDWHDVERVHGSYVTGVVGVLGKEAATEMWRRYMAERALHLPLYRGILHTARHVFGLSMGSFIRIFPFGFQQTFRDCAEVAIEITTGQATVSLALVPAFARYGAYAAMLQGIFEALIVLARAEGNVRLAFTADFPARRIVGRYSW